jgi:hypothetical protein
VRNESHRGAPPTSSDLSSLAESCVAGGPATADDDFGRGLLAGLDPNILTSAVPTRRVSQVPEIQIALDTTDGAARLAITPPPPGSRQWTTRSRSRSVRNTAIWAFAATAAILSGGALGYVTRSPAASVLARASTRARTSTRTLAAAAALPRATGALLSHGATVAIHAVTRDAVRIAHDEAPPLETPTLETPATETSAIDPLQPAPHHHHHHHHSHDALNGESDDVPETAATETVPTAPNPVDTHPPNTVTTPAAVAHDEGTTCVRGCNGNLDCMAACAVHPRPAANVESARPAPEPERAALLPDTPSRHDVVHAIRAVAPAVRECAAGHHDTAFVTFVFNRWGRVTTADSELPYLGTPIGACISRAVRAATVPPFTRSRFSVRAPFEMP